MNIVSPGIKFCKITLNVLMAGHLKTKKIDEHNAASKSEKNKIFSFDEQSENENYCGEDGKKPIYYVTIFFRLSGLISRWMKFLLCINSIREMSWSANRTVFRLNFLEQKLNKSSREGPSSSITLKSPSDLHHLMVGIPTPPCIIR